MPALLPVAKARAMIVDSLTRLDVEHVPLSKARTRVLAENIVARVSHPPAHPIPCVTLGECPGSRVARAVLCRSHRTRCIHPASKPWILDFVQDDTCIVSTAVN